MLVVFAGMPLAGPVRWHEAFGEPVEASETGP